jgi:hypothetical protein
VESRGSAARAVRIGSMFLIVLLAFAAGAAVRGWGGESGAVAPKPPTPLDEARAAPPIRLVQADPGELRRPTPPRQAAASETPAASTPRVVVSPPAAAPTPPPQPSTPPAAEPVAAPSPQATPIGTFDSEE